MPSDLVVTVRQISNYPATTVAGSGDSLLMQQGGPGAPYASINAADLVQTALQQAGPLGIGVIPPASGETQVFTNNFVVMPEGALLFNQYWTGTAAAAWQSGFCGGFALDLGTGTFEWDLGAGSAGQPAVLSGAMSLNQAGNLFLPRGTLAVARDPALAGEVATLGWVGRNTVASFNNRNGQVILNASDVYNALKLCDPIATQPWVQQAINQSIQNLLYTCPFVNTWNGRKGSVYLMLSDITTVFYQSGQQPISPTPAADSNDDSIATTSFVNAAIDNLTGGGPFLPLAGGNLTGQLSVAPSATAPNQIVMLPLNPQGPYVNDQAQIFAYYVAAAGGGTSGDVVSNARIYSSITGAPNSYVYNMTNVVDYVGTGGSGQLVAIYDQALRRVVNAGGSGNNPEIFGGVFEVVDFTNTDSAATNSMNGIEIDMTCGNTDSARSRRGFGMYLNRANATDVAPVVDTGVHLAANVGSYNTVIKIQTPFNEAALDLRLASATSVAGHSIWLGSAGTIAMDTGASLGLSSDGTGGLVLSGSAGQPAIVKYQPGGPALFWSGVWSDGSFYIAGGTPSQSCLTIGPDHRMTFNGSAMGFNDHAPIPMPTVTGSRAGNAALQSLVAALASYGLVADNTTP